MNLNEYIKMSHKRPNRQVLKALGASEELIQYLQRTPWNTNINVVVGIESRNESNNLVDSAVVGTATAE